MSNISAILYPPTLDLNYLVQRPQQLMKSFAQLDIPVFFLNRPSPHQEPPTGVTQPYPNFYLFNNADPNLQQRGISPVVYYSAGAQVDTLHQYNPSMIVFDSVDEPSNEFEAWRPFYVKAVSSADVVIATSEKLYSMALGLNPNTYLVPNGCDYEYLSQAASRSLPVPDDIAHISGPIIGYLGVIASWLDFDLIDRLAAENPHCNIVMVGPLYNVTDVPRRDNIHYLGFKPYDQLAAYLQVFDVGIIPFKMSSMVESVNPIKMWEYMAAGLPIVTTDLPEARPYQELVLCSGNDHEFMANIYRALYEDSQELRNRRMLLAQENSWLIRAQHIINIIETHLAGKGAPPVAPVLPPIETIPLQVPPQFFGEFPFFFSDLSSTRRLGISRGVAFRFRTHAAVTSSIVSHAAKIISSGTPTVHYRISRTAMRFKTARVVSQNGQLCSLKS